MWKNVWLCQVLIIVIFSLDILGSKIGKPFSREKIYIDVLNNITHVKTILNELLGSYKHLKALYEAQLKSENELSKEKEVNDENKNKNNKINYDIDTEPHPVTQMILFDDSLPEENNDKSSENVDVGLKLQPQLSKNNKVHTKSKNKEPDTSRQILDLTRSNVLFQNELPNTESSMDHSNKPELLIIGTALRYDSNMPNKENEDKKIKSDLKSISQEDFSSSKTSLRAGYYNIDEFKSSDNLYKDMKHSRIWKRPNDFSRITNGEIIAGDRFNNKTILVFVVNKQQKDKLFKNNKFESDSEEILQREEFKSKILRDAYGQTCIRNSIRKCYKVLREVQKVICMDFKCKDSFKEYFTSHSKTGCIKEFDDKGNNIQIKQKRNYKKKRMERNDQNSLSEVTSRRLSNTNYYDLCLPVIMSGKMNNRAAGKMHMADLKEPKTINALRCRYVNECKQVTRQKCQTACYYAVTNTCNATLCAYDLTNAYKKICRNECKNAFGDSDSDDDDSDDDSDSDSYYYKLSDDE